MSFEQERSYGNAPRAMDTASGADLRGPTTGGSGNNEEMMRRLDTAMNSPYAIEKLLNRLKQSIYSAREFSTFLRERSVLEDRYAQGYKKLVRHASDVIRRTDARQGSYARSFGEFLLINERLADNGVQLANTLQLMSDELRDIAERSEKGRKHWKHTTIENEKQLTDADTARQRAQDKYKNAADQYERARAGERTGKFGLKKGSQAEQEQAFKEKVDALDAEYAARATTARDGRREYETTTRPNIARALQDVISECDAVLSMQLTKLASLTEKHIVGSGMAVAPIRTGGTSGPEPRGLRHAAQDIDNHRDFLDYMTDGVEPTPLKGRSRRNTDVDLGQTPVQPADDYASRPSLDNYNNRSSYQAPLVGQHDSKAPQLPDIGHDSFSNSFEMQRPGAQNRSSYLGGQPDLISKTSTNPLQQTGVIQDTNATSLGAGRGPSTTSTLPPYNRESSTTSTLPAFDRASPPQPSTGFGAPPRTGTAGAAAFGQTSGPHSSDVNRTDNFARSGPVPGQNLASNDFTAPQGPPPRSNTMGIGNLGPTSGQRTDGLPPNQFLPPSGPNVVGTQGFNRDATPPRQEPYSNNNFTNPTGPLRAGTSGPNAFNQSIGQPSRQDTMGPNLYNQPSTQPSRQDTMLASNRNQSPPMGAGTYSGPGQPAPGSYLDPGRNAGPYGNNSAAAGIAGLAGAAGATSAASRAQQQNAQQRNLPSQAPPRPALPPNNPVFGIHLDELFRRDQSAVPAIVFQCIQAIDTFGMHTEGIYRVPGSAVVVSQLKNQFDHDSTKVHLDTPASFSNDINSVATLLKTFLRDLPDPLMTRTEYNGFISAAREQDNIMRRDGLHQQINALPDANYATLRVLVLHLHRVAMNADSNKMTLQNLSTVFGPTVMGGAGNVNDAGLQTKVMETILQHTHDIFDPDE